MIKTETKIKTDWDCQYIFRDFQDFLRLFKTSWQFWSRVWTRTCQDQRSRLLRVLVSTYEIMSRKSSWSKPRHLFCSQQSKLNFRKVSTAETSMPSFCQFYPVCQLITNHYFVRNFKRPFRAKLDDSLVRQHRHFRRT